jgi:hypothetical protein
LSNNLYGLEIDSRCVEIAVFALALAAWTYRDENGVQLGLSAFSSPFNIACCGLKVAAKSQDWQSLVPEKSENKEHLREGLLRLHETFKQAPLLGSLLDPMKVNKNDLLDTDYSLLQDLLSEALSSEQPTLFDDSDNQWDLALSAKGLLEAANILNDRYDLVITNVPYLARAKQNDSLKLFCETYYPEAKNDLANVFLERCLELSKERGCGVAQIVMPQNWMFLGSFKAQRETLLQNSEINFIVKLGGGAEAFENGPGNITNICLISMTNCAPNAEHCIQGIDVSKLSTPLLKRIELVGASLVPTLQKDQLGNADSRILLEKASKLELLNKYADSLAGILNGDSPRFLKLFWEIPNRNGLWSFQQTTQKDTAEFGGLQNIVFYDEKNGHLREEEWIRRERLHNSDQRGQNVVGKYGVAVSQMGILPVALFLGSRFDSNIAVIVPKDPKNLPAIWSFCSSDEFNYEVRKVDQKVNVTNATLVKVPFDINRWEAIAKQRYPNGLPAPYSDDPTQWIFHGHPRFSTNPLQVAVSRILGYTWPAESDDTISVSDDARSLINKCKDIRAHTSDDGIVCLSAVRGELPMHERLLELLIAAWETTEKNSWKPSILDGILSDVDCAGKSLDGWLRDNFFEQHSRLFQHRPFIWHISDGLRDGFSALVNYHKLNKNGLEKLIHAYLGDWISLQEAAIRDGVDGAEQRLAAAQDLKNRLSLILDGEFPFDIFIRWKPLNAQPVGWSPDLNDGIRQNIRPFAQAGVLRHSKKPKLNINWEKDRGKDVHSAPWFELGASIGGEKGDRINAHHLSLAEKIKAKNETIL